MSRKEEHQVLSPREQAYLKPGMWIGSTVSTKAEYPILVDGFLQHKEIEYVPALVKLVEEIYTNSSDEHIRTINDKKLRGWILDSVDITVQPDGQCVIRDNGGIDTGMHSSGVRVLQAIFGNLFSSSNYDESEERLVAGTNGVGSSLTNIFSNEFIATTADGKNELQIKWADNMANVEEVYLKKSKQHFTEIRFKLDLDRFKITELSYGTIKLIESKVIAMAAYNDRLNVTFNEESYNFNSLVDYVKLFGYDEKEIIHEKNADWEHCTVANRETTGFHIGIINGALCSEGEMKKHHDAWTVESIRDYLKSKSFKKRNEGEIIEPTHQSITSRLNSFVKASVVNPEYDSQSKDCLTSTAFLKDKNDKKRWRAFKIQSKFEESEIVELLIDWYRQKKNSEEAGAVRKKTRELKKTSAKSLRKLIDATGKTKRQRQGAILYIYEGDSAGKSFRTARNDAQKQGALFLRGKCKNSYGMSTLKLISNEEFKNIIVALGLDPSNPDNMSGLRYDKLAITTDMDKDGDSICGQLITMFVMHFPEFVRQGRLVRSITPLYVCKKGKQEKYFFSKQEHDKFNGKGWTSKYMKGLGSLEKRHFEYMLENPIFQEFVFDDRALELVGDWMGGSSTKRKMHLSA